MDMPIQRVWSLVQFVPLLAGLSVTAGLGLTAGSVDAAEVSSSTVPSAASSSTAESAAPRLAAELSSLPRSLDDHLEAKAVETRIETGVKSGVETTDPAIAAEPFLQFSQVDRSLVEIAEKPPNAEIAQPWTDQIAQYEWQLSRGMTLEGSLEDRVSSSAANLADENTGENTRTVSDSVSNNISGLASAPLGLEQPTSTLAQDLSPDPFPSDSVSEGFGFAGAASKTQRQGMPLAPSELEHLVSGHWQIAQVGPASGPASGPVSEPTSEPDLSDPSQTDLEAEASPRWRFSFTPYGFVPLNVSGDVTVRNFTVDLDLSLSDILDRLNFALAGRAEAWRGNLGIIFDAAYFKFGDDVSTSLPIPNCLCDIFPSQIDTDVDIQYGQFDLGVGYRHGENLSTAATEFDMGPLVFDAILGIRIYTFQQEIDISTNVGIERNLESSATLVTPLASGRVRWNLSPTVAGWVRGDIAGFGIGGTLLAASVTGGLDWMFAGDTSLQLAYRLSSLEYNTEVAGEELGLDALAHGPYVGVVFRF